MSARQRKKEKEQRRALLNKVFQSKPIDKADSDSKNEEYLAAKKRKREEEKKAEDLKKTLLDKHNEKLHEDQGKIVIIYISLISF